MSDYTALERKGAHSRLSAVTERSPVISRPAQISSVHRHAAYPASVFGVVWPTGSRGRACTVGVWSLYGPCQAYERRDSGMSPCRMRLGCGSALLCLYSVLCTALLFLMRHWVGALWMRFQQANVRVCRRPLTYGSDWDGGVNAANGRCGIYISIFN